MKYVVMPPIKLIIAITITLIWFTIESVCYIIYIVWFLNFKYNFSYEPHTHDLFFGMSPYYKRNPNYFGKLNFKSYFHYIWNIK